jgi:hypothetical protein
MECSFCHSTNLVKVSLAYEQGLSELQSRSRLGGLSLATSGLGFWSGEARTTGTVQTRLSARLSPPTKMSYWKTALWWLLGLLALWFVGIALMPENAHKAKEFGQAFAWVADAYAGALVLLWCFIWRYNHRVFPIQHRRWDHSFMCRRCGKMIRVNGDASAGDE